MTKNICLSLKEHIYSVRKIRLFRILIKLCLYLISLLTFVLALVSMKEGAKPLYGIIRNHFSIDSPSSAIGFGWLSASIALSGSPVAATALALLDADVLNPPEAFGMIAGSRLGASFIVLLVGFVYLLRGKKREVSLGVGLLSMLVTQTIYIPILALGFFILSRGWLVQWQVNANHVVESPFEMLFAPVITKANGLIPIEFFFPLGFIMIIGSLWLFDHVLPNINLQETSLGLIHHLLYRPVVTFLLGAVITALTMSVSVSLSLLVPLSARGYIRRENIIPYIFGANITTFIDTLIAGALLTNPTAVTVVLIQMFSVTVVSIFILLIGFRLYKRTLESLVTTIGRKRFNLAIYIFLTFLIPFGLILFS